MSQLPIALRAFIDAQYPSAPRMRASKNETFDARYPDTILILDVETSTDATLTMPGFASERWNGYSQSLLFGRAMLFVRRDDTYAPHTEYVFYPDDLPDSGVETLRQSLDAKPLGEYLEPNEKPYTKLHFLTLSDFLKVLWYYLKHDCTIAGFNIAFDLSRIAKRFKRVNAQRFLNGYQMVFWTFEDGKENPYRPTLRVKHIGSAKTLYEWSSVKTEQKADNGKYTQTKINAKIIDVRQLLYALTSNSYSLDSASKSLLRINGKESVEQHGIITKEYVHYNRTDVLLTMNLLEYAMALKRTHPIPVSDDHLYSPASIAKGYLKAMQIKPLLPTFPKEHLGYAMTAYYGGRTEVMLTKAIVPVVHVDFTSMYATVDCLLNLWPFVIAKRVRVVECTDEIQTFVNELAFEGCFDPTMWNKLCAIALIDCNGDILPVRARYQTDTLNIGINRLYHARQWFFLPDIIASVILSGKKPCILKAYRYVADDPQDNLKPVKLMNQIDVNPYKDNLFKLFIEERQKVKRGLGPYSALSHDERARIADSLKILSLAGLYGIFAEVNRQEWSQSKALTVYGLTKSTIERTYADVPGTYYFAPIAGLITSAARLMLAILEKCVADRGGTYVACDTDSMMIVASRERQMIEIDARDSENTAYCQTVTTLSYDDVQSIIQRFEKLNPYDKAIVPGSVLEVKSNNTSNDKISIDSDIYCYAISAKRYALATRDDTGRYHVIDAKESGLGFMLNPYGHDFEHEFAHSQNQLAKDIYECVMNGQSVDSLTIANVPLVRPLKLNTWTLYERFAEYRNAHPTYLLPESFAITTTSQSGAHYIAPFEKNPQKWNECVWIPYRKEDSLNELIARLIAYTGLLEDTPYTNETQRKRRIADFVKIFLASIGTIPERDSAQYIFQHVNSMECDDIETHKLLRYKLIKPDVVALLKNRATLETIHPHTLTDYLTQYLSHYEPTANDALNNPCNPWTRGLLSRRDIAPVRYEYTGKEGDKIATDEDGTVNQNYFRDLASDYGALTLKDFLTYGNEAQYEKALAVLQDIDENRVAVVFHVNVQTVRDWRLQRSKPKEYAYWLFYVMRFAIDNVGDTLDPLGTYLSRKQTLINTLREAFNHGNQRDKLKISPKAYTYLIRNLDSLNLKALENINERINQ